MAIGMDSWCRRNRARAQNWNVELSFVKIKNDVSLLSPYSVLILWPKLCIIIKAKIKLTQNAVLLKTLTDIGLRSDLWLSIVHCVLRADLLFTYKLVFGLLNINVADFSITRISNSQRGHCHKLYLPTCKSNTRYNYFSHRVIRVWNRLPEKTNFQSFNAFRETLTSEILIKFCKVYFM